MTPKTESIRAVYYSTSFHVVGEGALIYMLFVS